MNFIVLDIETTGLDITRDNPIQIAWEVYNEKYKRLEQSSIYIKTNYLHPKITEITKITIELLREKGITPQAAANVYHSLLWKYYPAVLVGYNIVNFDFPMIQNWLVRNIPGRFKHPPSLGIQDVMFMCCVTFNTRKWIKLVDAGKRFKIKFNSRALHNAGVDVNLTWKIFEKLCPLEEFKWK